MKLKKTRIVAFVLACGLLLLPGCAGDRAEPEETSTAKATETEQTTTVADSRQEIQLSENYSYKLPAGFTETEGEFADFVKSGKCFLSDDENLQIRSWIVDDGFRFPDEVEAMAEEEGWELGYGGLYDTAIAKATGSIEQGDETFYLTLFVWPDGPDTGCFVEISSPNEVDSDLINEIRASIHCSNAPSDTDTYGFHGEWTDVPSQEEIDHAMLQEAQEAYEDQMEDVYESEHLPPFY